LAASSSRHDFAPVLGFASRRRELSKRQVTLDKNDIDNASSGLPLIEFVATTRVIIEPAFLPAKVREMIAQ
jgi:hypothetical protein